MNRRRFLQRGLATTLATGLGGLGYAALEAGWLQIVPQKIVVPRLPRCFEGTTVALLTDVHLARFPFLDLDSLRSAVAKINGLQPDLIALGGDFLYGPQSLQNLEPCMAALANLRAPLGVFAVLGNHDHHYGLAPHVQAALREHGVSDLTNVGRWIERGAERLRVGGVDDFRLGKQNLAAALSDATCEDCCLLLSHNPDYVETLTDPRVGLVLSGHLHGGQIRVPGLQHPYVPSLYGTKYLYGLVQGPRTQVFVSRGLGTVGLPLRFRAPPEINLLTLAPV